MSFLPFYIYFMALSFLISLTGLFPPRNRYPYLKIFPVFLFATLIVETLGPYMASKGQHNVILYNFFTAFEFCFYLFVISLIISSKKVKNVIRIIIVLYALIAVGNILFYQGMNTFHTVTYSLGSLLVVGFCVYYFLELFRLPKSVELWNNPAFWICSGLLFYYCCAFPLFGLVNYWIGVSKLLLRNFSQIVTILNIFLYSLFSIAFLCVKTRKYTLSSS